MLTILSVGLTHSQTTPNTSKEPAFFSNTRPITYRKINEALKYADFKKVADKNDSIQQSQLAIKDSIITALTKINDIYKNKTVPNLEHQIALYKQKEVSNEKLYAIEDERWQLKYDKLKSKKLGIGFSFGYGVNTMGISPSINISLNYTLFRL